MSRNKRQQPRHSSSGGSIAHQAAQNSLPKNVTPISAASSGGQSQTILRSTSWAGPLPPPEILGGYDKNIPRGAERLVEMVEREEGHRISMEERDLREHYAIENRKLDLNFRSRNFAFFLISLSIVAAAAAAYWTKDSVIVGMFLGIPVANVIRDLVASRGRDDEDKGTGKSKK